MKSGYRNLLHVLWAAIPAMWLTACGGGGAANPNHAPVVASPNGDQLRLIGFPYEYDVTKSGLAFRDPDGDTLAYTVAVQSAGSWCDLGSSGFVLTGASSFSGECEVMVTASDGRGGVVKDEFIVRTRKNQAPTVAAPNPNREVMPNTGIDYDATQGGQTFTDAEGHALTYEVSIVSAPAGFSVQGTRIIGMLSGPGFVKAKIVARDAFNGVTEDSFALVVPSIITARPTLPATPFVYEDLKLPLPSEFQVSSGGTHGFSDTTPPDNEITDAGAALGRVLFYDKRLSITNTHSCGSCHEQTRSFASSQRFPPGAVGVPTRRSPMALVDVRFNIRNRHFSDERVGTLEDLALMPIQDRDELGTSSLESLVHELEATDYYPPLFSAAFGSAAISSERIAKALAQFLRSMISYESPFDRAELSILPDPPLGLQALTAEQQRGFAVFVAEQNCVSCHNRPTFMLLSPSNNGLDAVFTDPGAGEGKFRTPSLKNIAVSGPYMHDGRLATLREVIEHYNSGVQNSASVAPGLVQQRNMLEVDKVALEAFLNALTDDAFLTNPKFSDPFQ